MLKIMAVLMDELKQIEKEVVADLGVSFVILEYFKVHCKTLSSTYAGAPNQSGWFFSRM